MNIAGSVILALGLYNIHSISDITEGGALGLTLLLEHWIHISPAVSNCVITVICYFVGWRTLGRDFLLMSGISVGTFSVVYAICEQFPPVYPAIAKMPLAAAVLGAVFVGVGVGFCVKAGGAPTGDDAFAMSIHEKTNISLQWVYLAFDLIVLAASLSYIPYRKIAYSLLSVILSGQIVGRIANEGSQGCTL